MLETPPESSNASTPSQTPKRSQVPLHLFFLGAIGWLIWAGPGFARSAISSIGFVVICFGCESVLFDSIADRFARGV
jgi:hypothetical protein